jgi:hypothetical protein
MRCRTQYASSHCSVIRRWVYAARALRKALMQYTHPELRSLLMYLAAHRAWRGIRPYALV